MTIAVFDYAVWSARFPQLVASVSSTLAASLFSEATILLDNTDSSPVADAGQRLVMLNLIVAHLGTLMGTGASGTVGRVSQAQEGTVQTQLDYGNVKTSAEAYWVQTPYGAQYWAMSAQYRSFSYVPGPQPYLGVPGGLMGMQGPGSSWPL